MRAGSCPVPLRLRMTTDERRDPPWWSTYFDDVFLRIYRPLKDDAGTAAEVDGLCELLGLEEGARILDVGCGWGRHSLELARLGFQVTGLDLSARLLEEAANAARAEGLEIEWVQGDMRKMAFDARFDAAISMFSSLGYFDSEEDDLAALRGMREAVVPGGRLLLETMHRDAIAREYVERDWWDTPEGDEVRVDRTFDAIAGVSHETLHWRDAAGNTGEKPHSIRIRSATEWHDLLQRAEWRPAEWVGDWELEPFTHLSERLIVLAERG